MGQLPASCVRLQAINVARSSVCHPYVHNMAALTCSVLRAMHIAADHFCGSRWREVNTHVLRAL
jgi:hypothetical protein